MANLKSDVQFNGFNLDLNLLIRAQYTYSFFDSINYTYNGKSYNNIAEFIYVSNSIYYAAIFGGSDLSVNSSNNVSGGTVTGFLNLYWTGSKWEESWGIESISYPASKLAAAAKTTKTSDDYKIIKEIMKAKDNITMSKYADTVSGYAGDDVIKGMGGNDILYGDTGSDKLDGGSGNDIIHGDVSHSDETYYSVKGKDTLTGGEGNDQLDGGYGDDSISGGNGNDLIYGAGGTDTMSGDAGNDILVAYQTKDRLTGGAGSDKFVFYNWDSSAMNATVTDFKSGTDFLNVECWSDSLNDAVVLKSTNFSSGKGLTSSKNSSMFVYDSSKGNLYFDADGKGSGKGVLIVTLTGTPTLSTNDFKVVDLSAHDLFS